MTILHHANLHALIDRDGDDYYKRTTRKLYGLKNWGILQEFVEAINKTGDYSMDFPIVYKLILFIK